MPVRGWRLEGCFRGGFEAGYPDLLYRRGLFGIDPVGTTGAAHYRP